MKRTRRDEVVPKGSAVEIRAADRKDAPANEVPAKEVPAGGEASFPSASEQRAVVFIDGNNWYYALKDIGIRSGALDYRRVAQRLVEDRQLREVLYYVGRVVQPLSRVRAQTGFVTAIREQGVNVFLGKSRSNPESARAEEAKTALLRAFERQEREIPGNLMRLLREYCAAEPGIPQFVEKQVDTMIAADLVERAYRDEYEVAYLLSADSDFVPPIRTVCRLGKKVFVVSPRHGHELRNAATGYITIHRDWFEGLCL